MTGPRKVTKSPNQVPDLIAIDAVHLPAFAGQPVPVVAQLVIPGEPTSWNRVRYNRKTERFYDASDNVRAKETLAWLFKQRVRDWRPDPILTFGVAAIFYGRNQQRRDIDNCLKLILDGLTGHIWSDDNQVTEVAGKLVWNSACPHTDVVIYVTDSRRRTKACPQCGDEFLTYPSWTYEYCSAACGNTARRTKVRCATCNKEITVPRSVAARAKTGVHYCSTECRAKRPLAPGSRRGSCEVCGGPTSKASYRRCSAHRSYRGAVGLTHRRGPAPRTIDQNRQSGDANDLTEGNTNGAYQDY
jgi:Holliday junction resolvase RusA-like endonuclease